MRKAEARTEALRRSGTLESAAVVGLDKLAGLARFVARSRYAAIHLLDDTLQHRVAQAGGLALTKIPVTGSMCLPVVEAETTFVVPDATQDSRFEGNPNTSGDAPVRFFAAAPLRDVSGVTVGTVCVFDDDRLEFDAERLALLEDLAVLVGEHLKMHSLVRQLGHAANHDALTALPNRALLSDRLAHAMTRRKRHKIQPVLAMIDLDRFKAINDVHGHQAGDEVLIAVAARLKAAVRPEDTVARLGGDEFVVLYDDLPADHADDLLDGLRHRLEQALSEPISVRGHPLMVTASIGFVRAAEGDLGYELLARADAAMYEKKARRHSPP